MRAAIEKVCAAFNDDFWLARDRDGRFPRACFAVTEPDAGLNTTHIKTRAVRDGDHYVMSGAKVWTSTAQVAHKMLILVRTVAFSRTPGSLRRHAPKLGEQNEEVRREIATRKRPA